MDFVERFWARVDKSEECWVWTSTKNSQGYGMVIVQSPGDPSIPLHIRAHRLSYLLHFGPPPDRLMVLHRCDNPPCVRPDHLFLGTAADNARDMASKGRAGAQQRTHCPHGHPYDEENTYIVPRTGHRQCRICRQRWRDARPKVAA